MKRIYFVGLPTPAKGIEDFNACAMAMEQAEFTWFCRDCSPSIPRRYPKIRFVVGRSDKDLSREIRETMDLLLCCSRMEGFCLPIAQALLFQKPVLAFRLPELYSVYGNHIRYVKPFQQDGMVQAIKEILKSPPSPHERIEVQAWIRREFHPTTVAERLLRAIGMDHGFPPQKKT